MAIKKNKQGVIMIKKILAVFAISIAVGVTGLAFSNEPEWISVYELHANTLSGDDLSYDVQASYRCSALAVVTSIMFLTDNPELSEQLAELAIKRAGNALMLSGLISKKRGADVDPYQYVGDTDFIISVMQQPRSQDLMTTYGNWSAYSAETTGNFLELLEDELSACKDLDAYADLQANLYLRNSVLDMVRAMGLSEDEIDELMKDAPPLP